jgi:hypothetical protein
MKRREWLSGQRRSEDAALAVAGRAAELGTCSVNGLEFRFQKSGAARSMPCAPGRPVTGRPGVAVAPLRGTPVRPARTHVSAPRTAGGRFPVCIY